MAEQKKLQTNQDASSINRRDFCKYATLGTAGLLVGAASTRISHALIYDSTFSRPEIIRFYPDDLSKVVKVHHANVWMNHSNTLNQDAVHHMLDIAIRELTGLKDATKAWAALFTPKEKIAIKVNTLFSNDCTHLLLVQAVTDSLQKAGIPAEHIIIYDRKTDDLIRARYPINSDKTGIRCHGANFSQKYNLAGTEILFSDILNECDALINIPILTGIIFFGAGISFALKNHYGTFNKPQEFHGDRFIQGVTDLNALLPIKNKTRLVIGDILTNDSYRSRFTRFVIGGNNILMSYDPVAIDTIGAHIAEEAYAAEGKETPVVIQQATVWLTRATELGLGCSNLKEIDLIEKNLV